MASNARTKKLFISIVVLFVVIAGVAFVAIYHSAHDDTILSHPLSDPRYGFQFITPTYLPNGYNITAKRISVATEGNSIYGISAEMNFRTVDWVYEIQDSKLADENIHTSLGNYDTNSIHPTCSQETAKQKQVYRLCHWVDYGKISVYEVEFIQNGVFVRTTFPAKLGQVIPTTEISNFVDSFKPASPPTSIVTGV